MKLLLTLFMLLTLSRTQNFMCNKENNIKPEKIGDDFNWSRYYNLNEIYTWLRTLSKKYPKWVSVIELPTKTYEGRPILIVKVDIPYCLCDNDRKKRGVFVESNIHAREWISSSVSTFFLNQLLVSKKGSDWFILARKYIWYFLVIANPDGFVYSHLGTLPVYRNWRKTRTSTPNSNCTGVDPNRNYPYRWVGLTDADKDCQRPLFSAECSEIYPGIKPLSEPCVKAAHDFLKEIGPNLHAFFSFHSYSQIVILPYAHAGEAFDNYDEMVYIGEKALCALKKRYGTEYNITNVHNFFQAQYDQRLKKACPNKCGCTLCGKKIKGVSSLKEPEGLGSSTDWIKATFRVPVVVTFELRPSAKKGSVRFQLPTNEIIPTSLETLDALFVFLNEYNKLHPPKVEKECVGYCYVVNDWYYFKEQNPDAC